MEDRYNLWNYFPWAVIFLVVLILFVACSQPSFTEADPWLPENQEDIELYQPRERGEWESNCDTWWPCD